MLTQYEADLLLKMEKFRIDEMRWEYPQFGGRLSVPLQSFDEQEKFFLDIRRARIDLKKSTLQNRGRSVVVLARLDLFGPPHRNPDGAEIGPTHLHLYREGYGDKWAEEIDPAIFTNPENVQNTLHEFMTFCAVIQPPKIDGGLFT